MSDEFERSYENYKPKTLKEYVAYTNAKYRSEGKQKLSKSKKKKFINSNWDDKDPIIKALYCLNYFL